MEQDGHGGFPTPEVRPAKVNNYLVIILSILLLVAMSIIGFCYFRTQHLARKLSLCQQASLLPATTPTVDPTMNWKTYQDADFLIKLPVEFHTASSRYFLQFINYDSSMVDGDFNQQKDRGKLKIEIYQEEARSLEEYLIQQKIEAQSAPYKELPWIEEKTIVDNQEAITIKSNNLPGFHTVLKHPSKNIVYSIVFTLDFDNYKDLANQILSTFQFTK